MLGNGEILNYEYSIELIKEMTQINSALRPELDVFLNDGNKYPELYKKKSI